MCHKSTSNTEQKNENKNERNKPNRKFGFKKKKFSNFKNLNNNQKKGDN